MDINLDDDYHVEPYDNGGNLFMIQECLCPHPHGLFQRDGFKYRGTIVVPERIAVMLIAQLCRELEANGASCGNGVGTCWAPSDVILEVVDLPDWLKDYDKEQELPDLGPKWEDEDHSAGWMP